MRVLQQILLVIAIASCMSSTTLQAQSNATFHEDIEAEIIITSVDTFSLELYDIYRFKFLKENGNGLILKLKGDSTTLTQNEPIKLKLCDIGTFQTIFNESDTTFIENVPLIYGKQEGLKDNFDTISYRGHFMLNGVILADNGEILLDFGNNSKELVFEICTN